MGMEFTYLGVRMRVTGYWVWSWGCYDCFSVPKLCADYVDANGQIRGREFSYVEAKQLAEELRSAGRPEVWP